MMTGNWRRGLAVHFALPAGFAGLLAIGAVAASLDGRLTATGVLVVAALMVAAASFASEPLASAPLALIGWLTVAGFARPPYSQLRPTGPLAERAAVILVLVAAVSAGAGHLARRRARRPAEPAGKPAAIGHGSIGAKRRLLGVLLALAALTSLTAVLTAAGTGLALTDHLLIYLVVVVAVAVVGGFWPAVLAAIAASLLLNWFFTPPLHTFTIQTPQNLLALLLFVTVAVAVSSVVHLAALRTVQAARSRAEAGSLLMLAQTVLGGEDTPRAILDHLTATYGGHAELKEKVAARWVRIAASGATATGQPATLVRPRAGLLLEVAGQSAPTTATLLAGFAAQAAAALDRERLRTQAAQAEALAAGNRMRTALLAAVSHDLRTPLASIKASVSSLRQQDLWLTADDQADLLATIEQNSDRLDGLIGNLLDMSRLHTGSLQPFLKPITVDEVAPVAMRGLDGASRFGLEIPEGLPLVLADPGLLERVLANLFSNALRHSPPLRPPLMRAYQAGDRVVAEVADHGPGVPDELKTRIFEPFQRFGRHKVGVGLGLAVAKGFIEAMGGTITAADTPSGGLTVRFTLPVAARISEPAMGGGAQPAASADAEERQDRGAEQ